MPYERFELTPAGRAAVPEDPRMHYWMVAYATLKEKKSVSRPEVDLNADEIKSLLRSDEKAVAAATGELCLAGRLPDVPQTARPASNPPADPTDRTSETARLSDAPCSAFVCCMLDRKRCRSSRSSCRQRSPG